MAATAWSIYNDTKLLIGQGAINFGTDGFKCALFTTGSTCGSSSMAGAQTYSVGVRPTNEHAATGGYTSGGLVVAPTWTQAVATCTFGGTFAPTAAWTATVAGMICRYAVIYDTTSGTVPLICWSDLESVAPYVVITDTNTLTISLAAGIFSMT